MNNSEMCKTAKEQERIGDIASAYQYYLEAALAENDGEAMYALANMYLEGDYVGQSYDKAGRYYTSAFEQGVEIAPRTLIHAANYWERRIPENEEYIQLAIKYYQKAAELGETYGYECLGKVYFNVGDYEKAYESLTKIKVRNACGCYYLARLYDEGLAVNEDKQKAIELYKKTVRLGYVGRKLVDIDAIEAKKRLRELGIDRVIVGS